MRLSALVVLVAIFALLVAVEAVDRGNFKTCDQSHFCKRQRRVAEASEKPRYVVEGPLSLSSTSTRVTGSLSTKVNESTLLLSFELISYRGGIVRMQINEAEPEKQKKRFVANDALVHHINDLETKFESLHLTAAKDAYVAVLADNRGSVRIVLNLFAVHLHRSADGTGAATVTANARQFFNFEQYREKREGEESGVWEEYFKSHQDSKLRGPESVAMDFTFHDSKHLFGLPEHAHKFALPSTRDGAKIISDPYRLYNLDVFEYELENPMSLYGAVPYVISHSQSGSSSALLWLNAAETWIDVDESSEGLLGFGKPNMETHWISESGIVDVFFFQPKNVPEIFSQYASVTGFGHLPPQFATAYHQCRWNYRDQADVAEVNAKFDEFDIPYDVIWLDIEHTDAKKYFTWDQKLFPTPEAMQDSIASFGRKMVTIVDPHIKRDGGYKIHTEAQAKGYYIKNKDGNDYDGHCWPGSVSYPDFSNPTVRYWWADKFAFTEYTGSTSALYTWNDMNEPSVFNGPEVTAPKDLVHFGGFEHRDVHNLYGMYYHMSTFEGHLRRNGSRDDRPFILTRSFFAGTQRYGAVWTGDNKAEWSHLRIASPMLLSLGVSGISFSGADVGGFFGNPNAELLTRWFQAGAFYPFFRGHAHIDTKRREPYVFGSPHTERIRDAIRGRYALLPYTYTLFRENNQTGMPILRPIWAEFPTDADFFSEDDEFLFGSAILVAPVFEEAQKTKHIRLPGGASQLWYNYHTLDAVSSRDFDVELNMESIPVYLRGGSIVPRKDRLRRSSTQMKSDPYTLIVAVDQKGEAAGRLYVDDGRSFAYLKSSEFLDLDLRFSNSILRSTPSSSSYQTSEVVERVLITGLQRKPTKATLRMSSSAAVVVPLEVSSYGKNAVLIRKPDAPISSGWEIQLHYD